MSGKKWHQIAYKGVWQLSEWGGLYDHLGTTMTNLRFTKLLLFVAACSGGTHIFAAKRMLIMDFRNTHGDPNFQYLEISLTESVRKYLHEKYEILEPEPAEIQRRVRDGYFLFPEEFHNKNVALQLGILTGQDVVLSGGFKQKTSEQGSTIIIVDVIILDVEHKTLVKKFTYELKVDSNLFVAIDKLAQRVVVEAKSILPYKGQYDFDVYAPVTQNQIAIFGGYNLNAVLPFMHKNAALDNKVGVVPADLGGLYLATEYRRDRFLGKNRFIGFVRGDATLVSNRLPVTGITEQASAKGFGFSLEAGIGYQILRKKRLFVHALLGAGMLYSQLAIDFGALRNLPNSSATGTAQSSYTGTIYGPTASIGIRSGIQINSSVSWEIGAMYQQSFLQGSTAGNIMTFMGFGLRI